MQQAFHSISSERVREIYLEGINWKNIESKNIPPFFKSRETRSHWTKEELVVFTPEEQRHRAQQWSRAYFDAAQAPEQHITRLDRTIGSLVQCYYRSSGGTLDEETIIRQTCALLSRLTSSPHLPKTLSAYFQCRPLHHAYFQENVAKNTTLDHINWHALLVTKWFDRNTIRLALAIVDIRESGHYIANTFRKYLDTVAEILETCLELSSHCKNPVDQQYWLIAQSFLWTSWYRCAMLYLHYLLDHQLRWGFDWERNSHLDLRRPLPDTTETTSTPFAAPQYMCAWAFKLLTSDRASIVKDFRGFRKRFSDLYRHNPGRCITASSQPCSGQGPTQCQRFTGMKIVDQSAHDFGCIGNCGSLIWDEHSYRSVGGARAVSISATSKGVIRYCQASYNTIAISHVWAHGSGGRPETGFNACLHERLVRLAQENSCDSYWMDTPCIPTNHDLRREAISYINKVFTASRMTLVWDRDIMSVDISDSSLATQESILCALLVCDWNIRAWTLLESMRARHNVHLLCKNNRVISLKDCLLNVHNLGAIDISNLFLTNQHLLPTQGVNRSLNPNPSEAMLRLQDGYVSIEESACLLAYRHASRPGDSTTIMSLLLERKPVYTAEEFWKSKIGKLLRTGLLFSSQPRLQCKGFGWAPAQPEVLMIASGDPAHQPQQHVFFDGSGTETARITAVGLPTRFATFEIPEFPLSARIKHVSKNFINRAPLSANGERGTLPLSYQVREHFELRKYRQALLLLPLHDHNLIRTPPYLVYRGISNGPIFGVVGSKNRKLKRWHWLGVCEWDPSAPWPKLRKEEEDILLV
jgi:hypothetical protein